MHSTKKLSLISLLRLLWKWEDWEIDPYGAAIHKELKYWFFIKYGCIVLRELPDGPISLRRNVYMTNPFSWILTRLLTSRLAFKHRHSNENSK